MDRTCKNNLLAFTLVEMSIVIAIIGLLAGAVFVGSSVLRQAELKTVISDYTRYSDAINRFKQQYGTLPGDLPDATNYWGDDATYCADAAVTNGSPGTCNGDGDGTLNQNFGGSGKVERIRAWQHLQLAQLLSSHLTGISNEPNINVTVPGFRNSNKIGWTLFNMSALTGVSPWYSNDLKDVLTIGKYTGGTTAMGPFLLPSEALQLDSKMDDGLPATGRVVALKPDLSYPMPICTTSAVDASARYNTLYKRNTCGLIFSLTQR